MNIVVDYAVAREVLYVLKRLPPSDSKTDFKWGWVGFDDTFFASHSESRVPPEGQGRNGNSAKASSSSSDHTDAHDAHDGPYDGHSGGGAGEADEGSASWSVEGAVIDTGTFSGRLASVVCGSRVFLVDLDNGCRTWCFDTWDQSLGTVEIPVCLSPLRGETLTTAADLLWISAGSYHFKNCIYAMSARNLNLRHITHDHREERWMRICRLPRSIRGHTMSFVRRTLTNVTQPPQDRETDTLPKEDTIELRCIVVGGLDVKGRICRDCFMADVRIKRLPKPMPIAPKMARTELSGDVKHREADRSRNASSDGDVQDIAAGVFLGCAISVRTWRQLAPLNFERAWHTATVVGDMLLVAGGLHIPRIYKQEPVGSIEALDLSRPDAAWVVIESWTPPVLQAPVLHRPLWSFVQANGDLFLTKILKRSRYFRPPSRIRRPYWQLDDPVHLVELKRVHLPQHASSNPRTDYPTDAGPNFRSLPVPKLALQLETLVSVPLPVHCRETSVQLELSLKQTR